MAAKKTKPAKGKPPRAKKPATKNKGGRPSSFERRFIEDARKLAKLGANDREVAEFFGVSEATLHRWKHTIPEFCDSLKVGKGPADERVEQSLFRRATGYKHDAIKIMQHNGVPVIVPFVEHVAPDTVACIFWLKNRRPDLWRDKIEHQHSGEVSIAEALKAGRERARAAGKPQTP